MNITFVQKPAVNAKIFYPDGFIKTYTHTLNSRAYIYMCTHNSVKKENAYMALTDRPPSF